MPRTSQQFKEMQQERIDSILESSLILYALNNGKITIDEVAKHANCSHGIIYHYFNNSEAIIEKLLSVKSYLDLKSSLIKQYKGMYAKDAIGNIAKTMLNFSTTAGICYGKILIEETGKTSLRKTLESLVEKGQKEGDITGGNSIEIVDCFFYLLNGYYLSVLLSKKRTISPPPIDNVLEIFRKRR
jgi:AcrR family transcriptional regulator